MTLTLRTERVHQDYNPSQTSTTPYTPPKNEEEGKARIQQSKTLKAEAGILKAEAAEHRNRAVEAQKSIEICQKNIQKKTDENNVLAERLAKIQAAKAKRNLLAAKNT